MSTLKINANSDSQVTMNVSSGSRVHINADDIEMRGVTQKSDGSGIITQSAKTLIQEKNDMHASSGGRIDNESSESLIQNGNRMKADHGGIIKNTIKEKKPFIQIEEGADNCTVEDCEFVGDRPGVKTNAKNTSLIRNKHSSGRVKDHPVFTVLVATGIVSLVVGIILLQIEYGLIA